MLANNIDSVRYSIVPMLVQVMHEAEKAAQHFRVHLNVEMTRMKWAALLVH